MPFFYRNPELIEGQISKFHLTFIIINLQNSSSFRVRCSDWEDSEKGFLIQSYTVYLCWSGGKILFSLVLQFPEVVWSQLETWNFLIKCKRQWKPLDFFLPCDFFQNFDFHLKPRILSLEIKIFSPSPWIYSTNSTSSCDEKMSTK